MPETDDMQLLARFARENSEPAFAALLERYLNLVYSTALRSVGSSHAAQEITQAVFIILARKAGALRGKTILPGWLYQTTRLTAANFLRGEIRRQQREQEAYMQSLLNEPTPETWGRIAPMLDDALEKLGECDRHAIVLRYFENKSLGEVGAALGASEDAAKMRVNRALEKLRKIFARRGVTLSATLIAAAVSANSVHAAPAGLSLSVIAAAKGTAAAGSTLTLAHGALKLMAWTKIKTAAVIGAATLLVAGTTTVVVHRHFHPHLSTTDLAWADDPHNWQADSRVIDRLPPVFILRTTRFPNERASIQFGNAAVNYHFNKALEKDVDMTGLIADAYGWNSVRNVYPADLPASHFDLLFTLPEDWRPRLKTELKERFGLVAKVEKRAMDVLYLKMVNPHAPGLRPPGGGYGWESSTSSTGEYETTIQHHKLGDLTGWFEGQTGKPVLNQTGLNGEYDIHLKWKVPPGQSENEVFQAAVRDQLGLEFVPGRESVDLLVVKKTP